MDKEHLFYRVEQDIGMGLGKVLQYRINGIMSIEDRDLIQDALNCYKTKLQEEPCFSKLLKERKDGILANLDCLITKFDTMNWGEDE